MAQTLVLTVVGPDRPGLVETLSRTLGTYGGNWLDSRMARLADRFAGIAVVTLPEASLDQVTSALADLAEQGLRVTIEAAEPLPFAADERSVLLAVTGQDRPGVLHEITDLLAAQAVSIEALDTRVTSASWSGEAIFTATALLRLPPTLSAEALRELLEALANELMVDMDLNPSS